MKVSPSLILELGLKENFVRELPWHCEVEGPISLPCFTPRFMPGPVYSWMDRKRAKGSVHETVANTPPPPAW